MEKIYINLILNVLFLFVARSQLSHRPVPTPKNNRVVDTPGSTQTSNTYDRA